MDDLPNIAKYGIGGALALLAALALLWYRARLGREAKAEERREALRAELADAEARHSAALFCGDAAGAVREARRIDRLRRRLGLGAALVGVLLLSSCRTPPAEVRVVALSEHCRAIAPGETVPPLPEGEAVYWLCTPTGLRLMMPADSDLPEARP